MKQIIKTFHLSRRSSALQGWNFLPLRQLTWLIISFGILIRLVQYLSNRSLWADEAVLALNIINRSYLELAQPLDYEQGAPIGFLFVEKVAIQLLGNNEFALRLFPLLAGIVSLFLFAKLLQICLLPIGRPIALVIFANLSYLIYYSSEVKQYSSDVAIALILLVLFLPVKEQKLSEHQFFIYSFMVVISIWFSHPAILVLGSLIARDILISFAQKNKLYITNKIVIYLLGLLSFALFYFISVQDLNNNETLMNSWEEAFPSSIFDLIWFLDSFGKFFYKPLGFEGGLDGLAIVAFILGCFSYYYRNRIILISLMSPLLVTFLAASLHLYPFRSRLVLFLTPLFIIIIAEGLSFLFNLRDKKTPLILGYLIAILLIFFPGIEAANIVLMPKVKEEIKPVITYVKNNEKPGDILYIYQRGIYQFKYYAEKYGYRDGDYIIGVDDLDRYDGKELSAEEWERYKQDLDKLRGNQRVWLLFSHANRGSETKMIKDYLDRIGQQLDYFEAPGAFVYLYNLQSKIMSR
jgi:hypothetical protein